MSSMDIQPVLIFLQLLHYDLDEGLFQWRPDENQPVSVPFFEWRENRYPEALRVLSWQPNNAYFRDYISKIADACCDLACNKLAWTGIDAIQVKISTDHVI